MVGSLTFTNTTDIITTIRHILSNGDVRGGGGGSVLSRPSLPL